MPPVLVLIDVQRNMLLPPEPVPDADRIAPTIAEVLSRARAAGAPVIHIRNTGAPGDPDEPGTDGWHLVNPPTPGEPVVDKPETDAFVGTNLADLLPPEAHLIVAGMQTEYCVRSTVLGALNRNHPVTLIHGAHSTYPAGRPIEELVAEVEEELTKSGAAVQSPTEIIFD